MGHNGWEGGSGPGDGGLGAGCNIVKQITQSTERGVGAIFTLLLRETVNFTANCYSKDCIV